jgi:hypothetical protein
VYITVFGVPAHPLLVHATVVLVPLAALLVLFAALWPAARGRLGLVPLAAAVLAVPLVPLTTSTGEQLRDRLAETDAIRRHAEMADGLLPFVLLLAAAAAGIALTRGQLRVPARWTRSGAGGRSGEPTERLVEPAGAHRAGRTALAARPASAAPAGSPAFRAVAVGSIVLALLAVAGTVVQVVRIGDSGAHATWSGVPADPLPGNRSGH